MADAAVPKVHLASLMQAAASLLDQTERMPGTVTRVQLVGLVQTAASLLDQAECVLDRGRFETIREITRQSDNRQKRQQSSR